MVRQFRYPYGQILQELPAGKLEPGESPLTCGRRELEEETGFQAGSWESLGFFYPSPGYLDEVIHLYLAKDLRPTRQCLDEDEFLSVESVPFSEAICRCLSGEFSDGKTLVALLKYQLFRQQSY